jgi:hypothetical protein
MTNDDRDAFQGLSDFASGPALIGEHEGAYTVLAGVNDDGDPQISVIGPAREEPGDPEPVEMFRVVNSGKVAKALAAMLEKTEFTFVELEGLGFDVR